VELRTWESLNLLTVLAQSRAPYYLLWCRAEELAELLTKPCSAVLTSFPSSYSHKTPFVCGGQECPSHDSHALSCHHPHRKVFLSLYILFSSYHFGVTISLRAGGENNNLKMPICLVWAPAETSTMEP